jgi:glycosyltransferase involved in cell wall biosynthesis
MKTVLCRGPVLTQSGYGVHNRQVARWLLSRPDLNVTFQALPWGNTPWYIDQSAQDGLIGEIMKRAGPPGGQYDVTIQLQLPNEWDLTLGKFNVGMTAAVETDKCNPTWVSACNKMNLIIVPSSHTKANLFSHGGLDTPTIVIPEAYADACAKQDDALSFDTLPKFSTNFNFLVFGQITGNNAMNDRKNTFFTLQWLFQTFKDDPDVGIVLKTNSGRNSLIDKGMTVNMLKQVIAEVRRGPYPKVHLLHGEMTDDEVAALYRHDQIKALVALTRGEGYGLPILEAATSGLPVIATGWSGHLDFLKHGKYVSIYYQLGEVHPSRIDNQICIDNQIFMKGSRWANPSEEDFKKRVLKFRTSSAVPKEWAVDLQSKLLKMYSFEQISKQYDEAFKDIL